MDHSRNPGEPVKSGALSELPFLVNNRHISIEMPDPCSRLSAHHHRSAFVLKASVERLAELYGLEHLGFLTLTFAKHITCPREAQKRLNSLISNVIKVRYRDYLGVMERQKSGRIHYHLLIVCQQDVRTGVDFDQISRGNYRSAGPALRAEWAFWRRTAGKYRFGRTELLPVKESVEAISKYVGKYIAKCIGSRSREDIGVKLVRYSRGARAGTSHFQFVTQGSKDWRRKLATFAQIIESEHPEIKINSISDFSKILGPHWTYKYRGFILDLP